MKTLLTIVFIIVSTIASFGQDKFNGYYEPYIELGYGLGKNYSQEFTIEERTFWYDNESFTFQVKQLDLAHFSRLKLNDKNSVAIGLQYRFEENFVKDEENELRFTEEYTYTTQPNATEYEHRLRAEQRLTSSSTSHRFRYNIAVSRSFKGSRIETGDAYMIGDLETLLTVANNIKPEYEQRIGAGVGWVLSDLVKIELVTEYRLTDFTQNLGHELYLVTGMKIAL